MKKILLYSLLGLLSLSACSKDEDPIIPSGNYSPINFEFPQGNNDFDNDIKAIHDEYGVYLLYKGATLNDLNRSWQSAGGTQIIYAGEDVPEEYVPYYVSFFKNHIFPFISLDMSRTGLPIKIYFLDNYGPYDPETGGISSGTTNGTGGAMTSSDNIVKQLNTNGFDFWAISFDGEGLKKNDPKSVRVARYCFLYQMLKKAFLNDKIKESQSIRDMLDLTTPFVSSPTDPNYILTRGFPFFIYENFIGPLVGLNPFRPESPSGYFVSQVDKKTDAHHYFLSYIRLAMFYSRDEIVEKYADYPLILEVYDAVVSYMLNNYGIDLQGINAGPQTNL